MTDLKNILHNNNFRNLHLHLTSTHVIFTFLIFLEIRKHFLSAVVLSGSHSKHADLSGF